MSEPTHPRYLTRSAGRALAAAALTAATRTDPAITHVLLDAVDARLAAAPVPCLLASAGCTVPAIVEVFTADNLLPDRPQALCHTHGLAAASATVRRGVEVTLRPVPDDEPVSADCRGGRHPMLVFGGGEPCVDCACWCHAGEALRRPSPDPGS
jgi:hypothetical protein